MSFPNRVVSIVSIVVGLGHAGCSDESGSSGAGAASSTGPDSAASFTGAWQYAEGSAFVVTCGDVEGVGIGGSGGFRDVGGAGGSGGVGPTGTGGALVGVGGGGAGGTFALSGDARATEVAPNEIELTDDNGVSGCALQFTVSGSVASPKVNQGCTFEDELTGTEVPIVLYTTATLTLANDGDTVALRGDAIFGSVCPATIDATLHRK